MHTAVPRRRLQTLNGGRRCLRSSDIATFAALGTGVCAWLDRQFRTRSLPAELQARGIHPSISSDQFGKKLKTVYFARDLKDNCGAYDSIVNLRWLFKCSDSSLGMSVSVVEQRRRAS